MRNPTRRNRNIGTAKQGHGQNNYMTIPSSWHDASIFYEKLRNPCRLSRTINGKETTFLVEEPLADYSHCCTVDDICQILSYVPIDDWAMLDLVVLRQPTRKQKILSNVWGRLSRLYEYKELSGVAIVLEAQPRNSVLSWSKSLSPDDQRELDRLSADGHDIVFEKRNIVVASGSGACRNTQLFRTLPHEIGHYCHYRQIKDEDQYQAIPYSEREAAAHRYADELYSDLSREGKIPFEQLLNQEADKTNDLKQEWFN